MISYLIVAALAQASAGQAFTRLCPELGRCPIVQPSAESSADVNARRERLMALEAHIYGPLAMGRSPSACAIAIKRATDAQHSGIAAIIQALCRD